MKAFVVHGRSGEIAGLAICPPDGPALFPTAGPGQSVTEVDLPEDAVDFSNEKQAIEALKGYRIDVTVEARLVRR